MVFVPQFTTVALAVKKFVVFPIYIAVALTIKEEFVPVELPAKETVFALMVKVVAVPSVITMDRELMIRLVVFEKTTLSKTGYGYAILFPFYFLFSCV